MPRRSAGRSRSQPVSDTTAAAIRRVGRLGWSGLLTLWKKISAGNADGWPTGRALEYLTLRAFQIDGASVTWPYTVSVNGINEQIDGAIHTNDLHCLVECKDTSNPVDVEPLAKLRNQLLRRHSSTIGLVISRFGFTPPATTLAHYVGPQAILLWNGEELDFALRRRRMVDYLELKYRHHVEHGMPNFDIRSEEW